MTSIGLVGTVPMWKASRLPRPWGGQHPGEEGRKNVLVGRGAALGKHLQAQGGRMGGFISRVGRNHHQNSFSGAAFIFNQQQRLHHHLLGKTCWARTAGAGNTAESQPGLGRAGGAGLGCAAEPSRGVQEVVLGQQRLPSLCSRQKCSPRRRWSERTGRSSGSLI